MDLMASRLRSLFVGTVRGGAAGKQGRNMRKQIVIALVVAVSLLGFAAQPLEAHVLDFPTVDGEASVSKNGRRVTLSGTVDCTAGERVQVVATVLAGADSRATGSTALRCTEGSQSWTVATRVRGRDGTFSPTGDALAIVQAVTTDGSSRTATDAITLISD